LWQVLAGLASIRSHAPQDRWDPVAVGVAVQWLIVRWLVVGRAATTVITDACMTGTLWLPALWLLVRRGIVLRLQVLRPVIPRLRGGLAVGRGLVDVILAESSPGSAAAGEKLTRGVGTGP
jgi:hypothetical protein